MSTTKILSTQEWLDELVVQLRLRDVKGTAIGNAVASVESHLAESGETAQEAFGDPTDYARSFVFADDDLVVTSPLGWAAFLAPVVLGVMACFLSGEVVRAVFERRDVDVTWGGLAFAAVNILVAVVLVRFSRTLLENGVVFGVFCVAAIGLGVLALQVLRGVVFQVPVVVMTLLVVALLAVSALGTRHNMVAHDDPVIDPRSTAPQPQVNKAIAWVIVLSALACVATTAIPYLFR